MKNVALSRNNKAPSEKETILKLNSITKIEPIIKKQGPVSPPESKAIHPFTVVAIGASAGGLEAVTQLLQNLSPSTGMAYIYVQHLSPDHKSLLTPLLSKVTEMKVQDIDDMEMIQPDNVYVIPHDKEIEVIDGHIQLLPRLKNRTSNSSIDVLFSSLAETHKENVIGIVLSGSANDGTRGLKEIKLAGGLTFAQDDSAKFTSMPHSAIAEGVVDFVLTPKDIANELTWIGKHPLIKRSIAKPTPEDEIENNNPDLKKILQLLHKRKNVDFSHYKMNTIKRRMLRRMLIHKINTIEHYAEFLLLKSEEIDILYQDLLINVTEFFRDIEAFLLLKKTILPRLLKSKGQGDTLRIWVAACATGEEVYSIAMTLLEIQQNKTTSVPFQIFASDLSTEAINIARNGEYSINQLKNVSPKRLQQFFTKSKDKYRISKSLRDVCIFAEHNILSDPPFSKMDFISCRNFLIYLDTYAQKKAINTFHYALNEGGFLMLGKSETIGTSVQLFAVLNKKFKFYTRKKNSGSIRNPDITTRISTLALSETNLRETIIPKKAPTSSSNNLGLAFDAVLLSQYVPASVIINHDLEILQFKGPTSLYLQNSSGKASFNILKMAHLEITFELRNAIHHAIKTKQLVRKTGIEINRDTVGNVVRIINIEVAPLKIDGEEPLLIIVFTGQQMELPDYPLVAGKNKSSVKDRRIKKLEEELIAARADMGAITHDQEAANEELQSANEEIISSNEELQSLNEELETSKEEIESTNEELITSNQELHARIQQIEELYTYYEGIIATVHEPVLILDKNIRIKSANKSFCKMFHVIEDDIIGISLYKLGDNQWNIPRLRELLENIVPKNIRFHDFEVESIFPVIGQKTMLLNAHRIVQESRNEELIILTIADITEVKRLAIALQVKEKKVLEIQLEAEKKVIETLKKSSEHFQQVVKSLPAAVYSCDAKGRINFYNDAAEKVWGRKPVIGKEYWCGSYKLFTLDGTPMPLDKSPMAVSVIEQRAILGEEIIVEREDGTRSIVKVYPQPEFNSLGEITGSINMGFDISEQVKTKNELIEAKNNAEIKTKIAEGAVKSKQQFLSNMSHEIRTPMNAIVGFTNVVLKTLLNEKQKEYLNAIKISGDALVILINDILDLAKVEAGKMTFEHIPFNLSVSIESMTILFESKIKEKNLEFKTDFDTKIPQILVGDPMRLRQILLNLIGNAVKFTEKGSIAMQINLLNEEEEKVTIEFLLIDTGIGIAKNKLADIFNNFEQAHKGISSTYGGTGLGLSIVKHLVENQGGTVSIKSEIGKGSTFGFVMNFGKVSAELEIDNQYEQLINAPFEEIELLNIRILIAEDMPLNQFLIKIILADYGFEVDIAENGKIAIEKLTSASLGNQRPYDLILMDLQMPEMDGFEATKFIRNEMNSQVPIIALTADVTTMDVEKCLEMGMNDYISKPIDEKILYHKIIKCLRK
ncbi:MAG: CheR family methyltransferase [Bacteroidota bacterium]